MPKRIVPLPTPDLSGELTPTLIGQAIKARRTQAKLSIDMAASLCGVARHTFNKVERGDAGASIAIVLKILAGLGLSLAMNTWQYPDDATNEWR